MSPRKKYKPVHKNRICHGEGKTRLHNMWTKMIDRTDRPKELNYPRYGGKGIKTWDGWKLKGGVGFLAFKEHLLSLHPDLYDLLDKGYEIDRIDFTGNYEPGNVRIVDPKINDRNKSNNVWVQDLDGTKIAFCDFWEKYHLPEVSYKQAYDRFCSSKCFSDPMQAVRTENKAGCGESLVIPWEDYWVGPKKYCELMGLNLGIFNIDRRKGMSTEEAVKKQGKPRQFKTVTYQGETLKISEWAARYGLPAAILDGRLFDGWDFERAISQPMRKSRKRK